MTPDELMDGFKYCWKEFFRTRESDDTIKSFTVNDEVAKNR